MYHSPVKTTHPSIRSGTPWTKVTTVLGRDRKGLLIVNEDAAANYRIERCDATTAATLTATDGILIRPGGYYQEDYDFASTKHIYALQTSGATLATLAVAEGV